MNIENRVLAESYQPSSNFFKSDSILKARFNALSEDQQQWLHGRLDTLGSKLASEIDALSLLADKNGPVLEKRNLLGENTSSIVFHPAYEELKKIAVHSGMFTVKWKPELRSRFQGFTHRMGFLIGHYFSMGESGLFCPLCMTDGAARIIDQYGTEEDRKRLLPRVYTENPDELYTGAMFLTEKAGGSDVGANLVRAQHKSGSYWLLNGEKWFCSNANAELILALGRTDQSIRGTKGLSIFLVEPNTQEGSPNLKNIVRLKDKLGVRSMASAEIILTDTEGKLLGAQGDGFMIMTSMINLSRVYNSVAANGAFRRALKEAYEFLSFRSTFGKSALQHALVRVSLADLAASWIAEHYLLWRTIAALDKADNGDKKEASLLRLLTPMLKRSSAASAVHGIRECMELMGGLGYIEQGVMPKLMRDSMVLPIWEGAGNIMLLDMLRAAGRSAGLGILRKEINDLLAGDAQMRKEAEELFSKLQTVLAADQQTAEVQGSWLFKKLTKVYQYALLNHFEDGPWIAPARTILLRNYFETPPQKAPSLQEVHTLMGWEI